MTVLQNFATRAMEIQVQLMGKYKGGIYLRGRLKESIKKPAVLEFLRDRRAETSK